MNMADPAKPDIATGSATDTIEIHLKEMREAAENEQYEIVEARYLKALDKARLVVGDDGPLLLLLLCMSRYYEAQSRMMQAESFNKRARELILRKRK